MLQSSTEYLHVPVRGPGAASLDADQIEVAVTTDAPPALDSADWHAVDSYEDGVALHLVGPGSTHGQLAKGWNRVYVRATDSPEVPVMSAGSINIT